MKAKILKIVKRQSCYGGEFYHIFFRAEDGKSYRSCLYPRCRNFTRWRPIVEDYLRSGGEIWLGGLVRRGGIIDADSFVRKV